MTNILDLTLQELRKWMKDNSESEFRAKQVFDWIYKNVWAFSEMKNIPEALKNKLSAAFVIGIPEVVQVLSSDSDDTKKFLLKFKDGNVIEAVLMRYIHGNSICVSTQIGCKMGCKFCASTVGGVVRNLTGGEILAQVLTVQKYIGDRISNVVLMGSGEPFDNYDNVLKFLSVVNADYGLNIGQRHITLSTCGLVPKIYEFADADLQVTLAISLHAPNDELRKSMMPVAYKYSIEELIKACTYYVEKTNRRITFEYSLVKGVNDSPNHARELIQLLKGILCHVNLIPVNEVRENSFKKSTSENIKVFYNILTSHGIETTIRKEMGADINAACGQLRRSYLESENEKKEV